VISLQRGENGRQRLRRKQNVKGKVISLQRGENGRQRLRRKQNGTGKIIIF